MTRKKTILFVDDDIKRATSYVDMLTLEGYTVLQAESVDKAREELQENKDGIDLIILDLMMPFGKEYSSESTGHGRKTGLNFLKGIRKNSKKLPVIVLSVVRDDKVKEEAEVLGISSYLEKPCRPSKLLEAIEKGLNEKDK
jgi:two-component system phosphoglycerate transport system response regulator PgtA